MTLANYWLNRDKGTLLTDDADMVFRCKSMIMLQLITRCWGQGLGCLSGQPYLSPCLSPTRIAVNPGEMPQASLSDHGTLPNGRPVIVGHVVPI